MFFGRGLCQNLLCQEHHLVAVYSLVHTKKVKSSNSNWTIHKCNSKSRMISTLKRHFPTFQNSASHTTPPHDESSSSYTAGTLVRTFRC